MVSAESGELMCVPSEENVGLPAKESTPTAPDEFSPTPSDSTLNGMVPQSITGLAPPPNTIPSTWNCYAPQACVCRPSFKGPPPPPPLDAELLEIYRTELCPLHPFVIIPSHVTAEELSRKRPFLMQAIRAVATYHSTPIMQYQSYKTMQYLSEHMLIRASRSIDLLLGIIVYLGWYHKHCLMHAHFNNALHLAFALVADLGLNRNPQLAERTKLLVANPPEPSPRTLEERRAMLGVWYLSSMFNIAFSRVESLTYSRYVQSCVLELESAREYESDAVLVSLVRIQHLTAQVHLLNLDETNETILPPSIAPKASHAAYIAAYQTELDMLKNSLPRSLRSNHAIEWAIANARLHLYEPPELTAELLQKLSAPVSVSEKGAVGSLDMLYHSNCALKGWFDILLSTTASTCVVMPSTLSTHIIYAITVMGRWAKLTAPWLATSQKPTIGNGILPSNGNPCCDSHSNSNSNNPAKVHQTSMKETLEPRASILRNFPSPAIPPPIAALKAHLASTPGMAFDILKVLEAMEKLFENVVELMEKDGADDDQLNDNSDRITSIWHLAVRKIRISRAKLQRFCDMASQGAIDLNEEGLVIIGPRESEGMCEGATAAPGLYVSATNSGVGSGGQNGRRRGTELAPTADASENEIPSGSDGTNNTAPHLAQAPTLGMVGMSGNTNGIGMPPFSGSNLTQIPGFGSPGFGGVFSIVEGAEWLRNSLWATSSNMFEGLDDNMWWDGSNVGVGGPSTSGMGGGAESEWAPMDTGSGMTG